MRFESPEWFWLLPLVLAWGAGWGVALGRNYRRRQRIFADTGRHYLRIPSWVLAAKLAGHALLVGALACVVIALARPLGTPMPAASARKGVNLAVLVDGSRSMLCEDILPSRLHTAQRAVETVATAAAGSRFSLFMFGGAPTLLIPRTFDTAAVTLAARSVSPHFVGKGGTALDPAIRQAAGYLVASGPQPKAILIISDGEEGEGDPVLSAMQVRTDHGIRVHTITVGTEDGEPMPIFQRNQRGELTPAGQLVNVTGEPIVTRANPSLMARTAEGGGGRALHLTGGDIGSQVRQFVEQAILPDAVAIDAVETEEARELFCLPLMFGLALLLAEQALRRWVAYRFVLRPDPRTRGAVLGGLPVTEVRP